MKKYSIRIAALLLALALAVSAGGCVCTYVTSEILDAVGEGIREARVTASPLPEPVLPMPTTDAAVSFTHKDVKFTDMYYTHPDTDAIYAAIDSLLADLEAGKGGATALVGRYEEILGLYDDADSQLSLGYLLHAFDVTDSFFEDEYNNLVTVLNDLDLSLTDVSVALFESSVTGGLMEERYGSEYEETVYAGKELNSPEIQTEIEQEQRLTTKYDSLIAGFTITDGGRTWTMEEIGGVADTDYSEYERLYTAYMQQFNEEAGAIYIDMLALRSEVAKKLGYGSYAAYRYECYGRDFSVTDAKTLHKAVKTYLVPTYIDALVQRPYEAAAVLYTMQVPLSNFVTKLQVALSEFSPKVLESLNYMLRNDLYNFDVSSKKMESSFTTYLSNYDTPFIFTEWEGGVSDSGTLMHELGHFANYYFNPQSGWSTSDSLDLAEIDSQGLEMLLMQYYDSFYGGNAEAARYDKLTDAMYAVISGCMEDEFQQEVYADPSMTLEEMNALYYRLAEEYGFVYLYDYSGTEWAAIPHTFQSPMYYISYAVSMVPALELWELSQMDAAAAGKAYHAILERPAFSELRSVTSANGLSDPLAPETIRQLAEVLRTKLGLEESDAAAA